ncbi:hypothetical protein GJA_2828 [Janthinobacterium agaricidamnosum NBRC 102515 = DSM 9628]|uniref:Uncharacterized protein n=1 Tax=Janthinobacterium agaricidamnosum NBRC 102515 = DSM 9628 TaxID=1349767 RepID=W0V3R8_9BURK|nr:hypothetical protein GJA_2828 [Janthinobacterium agaricidamnosum NBRC 102515 = DSM 9628]
MVQAYCGKAQPGGQAGDRLACAALQHVLKVDYKSSPSPVVTGSTGKSCT